MCLQFTLALLSKLLLKQKSCLAQKDTFSSLGGFDCKQTLSAVAIKIILPALQRQSYFEK